MAAAEPLDPKIAALVADVERLEVRQAETQAAHMRAVADRKANEDCVVYDRCIEAIPAAAELSIGEKARQMKACDRAKSEGCRVAELGLERARSENMATMAELQVARERLGVDNR